MQGSFLIERKAYEIWKVWSSSTEFWFLRYLIFSEIESNTNSPTALHNECAMEKYLILLEKILNFISLNRHHFNSRSIRQH